MIDQRSANRICAEQFAAQFAVAFGRLASQACELELQFAVQEAPDLSTRHGEPLHFRVSVNGAQGGECFLEFYKSGIDELGAKILGQPGAAHESCRDAVEALITQTLEEVTPAHLADYPGVTFKVDRVADLVFGGMFVVPLEGVGSASKIPILLYFSSGFRDALVAGAPREPERRERLHLAGRNLDLVMDVELNVSLRFGQRQMPLRDVLELESGSVIELDRRVDDPVELLLDGKVIAVGEAVIVDGNYGLRVTSVCDPAPVQWK